jgi:tRNA pseudouridine38-40 synthase
MKRVLLKIAYDGTDYHGWQLQNNAVTVAETLESALEKLLGAKTSVTGCSRTDSGVHANEFFCHLDCDDNIPEKAFLLGLNALLPNDIAIKDATVVSDDFHARFNAKSKTYIYKMYVGLTDPFSSRYALRLDNEPDLELMNDFCKRLIGTHDFIAFSSSGRTVKTTVRTITECYVTKNENVYLLTVSGNGFLYNMVRIIAGTALAVGYKNLLPSCADEALKTGDRTVLGNTAAPQGLFLHKVEY